VSRLAKTVGNVVPQESLARVKANTTPQDEKSQAPSTKLQINYKFQYPMTETCLRATVPDAKSLEFGILVIVICLLFGIWNLVLRVNGSYATSGISKLFLRGDASCLLCFFSRAPDNPSQHAKEVGG
jgi:hypothetical protein